MATIETAQLELEELEKQRLVATANQQYAACVRWWETQFQTQELQSRWAVSSSHNGSGQTSHFARMRYLTRAKPLSSAASLSDRCGGGERDAGSAPPREGARAEPGGAAHGAAGARAGDDGDAGGGDPRGVPRPAARHHRRLLQAAHPRPRRRAPASKRGCEAVLQSPRVRPGRPAGIVSTTLRNSLRIVSKFGYFLPHIKHEGC
eukprot:8612549-Pyramimonas_sp.AAC.1